MIEAFKLDKTVTIKKYQSGLMHDMTHMGKLLTINIGKQDVGNKNHAPDGLWAVKQDGEWRIVTEEQMGVLNGK